MPDEQEAPVEQTVEAPEPAQENPEEVQVETAQTIEQPAPSETTEVAQEQAPPEETPPSKKVKLKWQGQETEVDETEAIELAQKGLDYTKKMQALSEVEKANALNSQLAQAVQSNPQLMKAVLLNATGMNDPRLLYQPTVPNEALKETYPDEYNRQVNEYNSHVQLLKSADTIFNVMQQAQIQQNNTAVLQRATLEHSLSPEQAGQLQQFVTQRMRPNPSGFYSSEDVNFAVTALFGQEQKAQALLKQSTKIQETIKKAVTTQPTPKKATDSLPPQVRKEREYKEFVKENQGGYYSRKGK